MCEDGQQSKTAVMLGKAASRLKWLYSTCTVIFVVNYSEEALPGNEKCMNLK